MPINTGPQRRPSERGEGAAQFPIAPLTFVMLSGSCAAKNPGSGFLHSARSRRSVQDDTKKSSNRPSARIFVLTLHWVQSSPLPVATAAASGGGSREDARAGGIRRQKRVRQHCSRDRHSPYSPLAIGTAGQY